MSKPGGGGAGGLARPAITLETSKFQGAERREPGRISATQAGAQLKRGGRGDDLRPGWGGGGTERKMESRQMCVGRSRHIGGGGWGDGAEPRRVAFLLAAHPAATLQVGAH